MALFGKKKETTTGCCCNNGSAGSTGEPHTTPGGSPAVKVLGGGCKKCNELEANTVAALTQLGMEPTVEHVTDFSQIAAYGVMSTPALVVNGKVVVSGKVAKTEEVVEILKKAQA